MKKKTTIQLLRIEKIAIFAKLKKITVKNKKNKKKDRNKCDIRHQQDKTNTNLL